MKNTAVPSKQSGRESVSSLAARLLENVNKLAASQGVKPDIEALKEQLEQSYRESVSSLVYTVQQAISVLLLIQHALVPEAIDDDSLKLEVKGLDTHYSNVRDGASVIIGSLAENLYKAVAEEDRASIALGSLRHS